MSKTKASSVFDNNIVFDSNNNKHLVCLVGIVAMKNKNAYLNCV